MLEVLEQSRPFKGLTRYQPFSFRMKEGSGALWAWSDLQIYFSGGKSVPSRFTSKSKIIVILESNMKH